MKVNVREMDDVVIYGGLFVAAFVAATILPMQSEALFAGLLISDAYSTSLLLAVASAGNILGSVVNWLLGRGIDRFRDRSWFPASKDGSRACYEMVPPLWQVDIAAKLDADRRRSADGRRGHYAGTLLELCGACRDRKGWPLSDRPGVNNRMVVVAVRDK